MLTHDQLVAQWGAANVYPASNSPAGTSHMPSDTKDWLTDIEFPLDPGVFGLQLNLLASGVDLRALQAQGAPGNYYQIGRDYETAICLKENDGSVWSIDPQNRHPTCFINSSIQSFIEFLYVYCHDWHGTPSWSGDDEQDEWMEQVSATIEPIKKLWNSIDSSALSDNVHFWPLILEQMRDGLL